MGNILLYSELFGTLFLVGNALTHRGNLHLQSTGVSVVQWQLCAALSQRPEKSANLSTLAAQLCTSRQNIKQVAQGLMMKGWLRMEKDPADSRALLLALTPECEEFWDRRVTIDRDFLVSTFGSFADDELQETIGVLQRLYKRLEGSV